MTVLVIRPADWIIMLLVVVNIICATYILIESRFRRRATRELIAHLGEASPGPSGQAK